MYFAEDHAANAADTLYCDLGSEASTSAARAETAGKYRWNTVLMDG